MVYNKIMATVKKKTGNSSSNDIISNNEGNNGNNTSSNDQENKIKEYVMRLGLDVDEANLYLALVKRGESTTLELSRSTKISRTQIYRLFESMKEKGFIEEILDKNTTRARAIPIERLDYLIDEQVLKVGKLQEEFSDIKSLVSGFLGANHPETKVLFYRGEQGLQQLAWNALRSKEELRGYTYRLWESAIGREFAYKWYAEAIKRGFRMRELYSDEYKKSLNEAHRSMNKGFKPLFNFPEFSGLQYEARYISPKTLNISHQVDIYNDVVAYYNWYKGEVFGIEIYNSKIAAMQKQIFDIVWEVAVVMN